MPGAGGDPCRAAWGVSKQHMRLTDHDQQADAGQHADGAGGSLANTGGWRMGMGMSPVTRTNRSRAPSKARMPPVSISKNQPCSVRSPRARAEASDGWVRRWFN